MRGGIHPCVMRAVIHRSCRWRSDLTCVPRRFHDERAETSAGAASHALQEEHTAEMVARLRLRARRASHQEVVVRCCILVDNARLSSQKLAYVAAVLWAVCVIPTSPVVARAALAGECSTLVEAPVLTQRGAQRILNYLQEASFSETRASRLHAFCRAFGSISSNTALAVSSADCAPSR